jgi:hypothetical protein
MGPPPPPGREPDWDAYVMSSGAVKQNGRMYGVAALPTPPRAAQRLDGEEGSLGTALPRFGFAMGMTRAAYPAAGIPLAAG